jgi:hypothetical protein
MHLHPWIHIELARIRQQELITKATRSRAALARLNLDRVAEPGLRRRRTLERDDPAQVEAGPC